MPQLDITSFTSQIVWLVAIYFTFYILLLKFVLPRLGRILKFRKSYKVEDLARKESQDLTQTIASQLSSITNANLSFFERNNTLRVNYSDSEFQYGSFSDQNALLQESLESFYIKKQLLDIYEKNS